MKKLLLLVALAMVGCANPRDNVVAGAAVDAAIGAMVGREMSNERHRDHSDRNYDPYRVFYLYLEGWYPNRSSYNRCVEDIRRSRGRLP
jgi:hypothetical protein